MSPEQRSAILAGDSAVARYIGTDQRQLNVFISSTFTDTATERNALIEDVYPYLRAHARRLGLEFNHLEMRCEM